MRPTNGGEQRSPRSTRPVPRWHSASRAALRITKTTPLSWGQLVSNSVLTRTIANNFRLRRLIHNDEPLNCKTAIPSATVVGAVPAEARSR